MRLAEAFVEISAKDDGLRAGLARAQNDTARAVNNMDKHLKRIGSTAQQVGQNLSRMGAGLTAGVTVPILAITGMFAQAAAEQEDANEALIAALGGTRQQAEQTAGSLAKVAAEIQKLTRYDDDAIIAGMAYGKNLGIQADKLDEAAKAAVGLAARFKIDLNTAFMLLGRASQGQTQMLARYGIVLDDTLSPQEKFNKLLEVGASSFGLAEAAAKTATGQFAQLKNTISDFMEDMGTVLLPIIKPLGDRIRELISWFTNLSPGVKTAAAALVALAAASGPVLLAIGGIVGAIGALVSGIGAVIAAPEIAAIIAALGASAAAAVVPLTGIGIVIWRLSERMKQAGTDWGKVWESISSLAKSAWEKMRPSLTQLWESIKQLADSVADALVTAWDLWGDSIKTVWKAIGSFALGAFITSIQTLAAALGKVAEMLEKIAEFWRNLKAAITGSTIGTPGLPAPSGSQKSQKGGGTASKAGGADSPSSPWAGLGSSAAFTGESPFTSGYGAEQRPLIDTLVDTAIKGLENEKAALERSIENHKKRFETIRDITERIIGFTMGETAARLYATEQEKEAALKEARERGSTLSEIAAISERYNQQSKQIHEEELQRQAELSRANEERMRQMIGFRGLQDLGREAMLSGIRERFRTNTDTGPQSSTGATDNTLKLLSELAGIKKVLQNQLNLQERRLGTYG